MPRVPSVRQARLGDAMTRPSPRKVKARDSKRVLWVVEREGRPVSMSASVMGPTACYANWSERVGHEVYKEATDRIVKYVPAPKEPRRGK